MTSLDVSKNITLDYLDCPNNLLTSLDTSKNINLFTLFCQNNLLKSIDLSKNIDLITLDCSENSLTSLNVSKNIELDDLTCGNNLLTSLDVFNNTVLRGLICPNNLLTSLDLSNNPITLLWAGNNSLTSLNIANGNNNNVMNFSVTDNPGLFCIQIDAGFTPNEAITGPRRWSKNRFASFSSNCTPVLKWLGTTNNDWHTATNWEKGIVPVATDRVEIPSGLTKYPTVSSEVTVSSITLQNNATLIGNERVNGIVIYNKTLTANWNLITPPVSNQTYDNLIQYNSFERSTITPTNVAIGIYSNNGSNEWNYEAHNAPRDGSSVGRTGLGLAVKLTSLIDINFIGNINVTNVHKPISVGDRTNFNLLGNPFTSYMNSENFVNTNSSLLNEKTIWLWNGTEYETYTLANPIKIEPARGFFVTAISDGM